MKKPRKLLNFRVSEAEDARFKRVAKHYGVKVSDVLRLLVKLEDDRLHLLSTEYGRLVP